MEYLVTWSIEVTADSPRAAAEQALEIQRDPNSLATCFMVAGGDIAPDKKCIIDLDDLMEVIDATL